MYALLSNKPCGLYAGVSSSMIIYMAIAMAIVMAVATTAVTALNLTKSPTPKIPAYIRLSVISHRETLFEKIIALVI